MGVGACTLSNTDVNLGDAILQARIDGKSWPQIADEFGLGSPGTARKKFQKLTGISDFKIKGKALKNMVDKGMLDDLKKAVPKKPPVGNTGPSAPSMSAAATEGTQGTFGSAKATIGDDLSKVMNKTFGGNSKITLDSAHEVGLFAEQYSLQHAVTKGYNLQDNFISEHGITKYKAVLQDIKAGKYYSDITKAHGISFAEVDAVFWSDTLAVKVGKGSGKGIWEAYKLKPTSEYGFKAVQDVVWDLKKLGATAEQIADKTGVDDAVVKLILDNKWSLPGKGSKQYVGYPSGGGYSPSGSTASSTQTSSQLIGESNSFNDMTKSQADQWAERLGLDLTDAELNAFRRYTGSAYGPLNRELRDGGYIGSGTEALAKNISSGMRPIPENVTLRRGTGVDAFPGGVIPDVGTAWSDAGFMSSSYGGSAGFAHKPVTMVLDVPAGIKARPLQKISGFGESEREILLDRNIKWVVTGKERSGGKWIVYMKAVL